MNSMPDWHRAEVTSAAHGSTGYDYYVSDRALGHLYREIALCDAKEPLKDFVVTSPGPAPLDDAISRSLAPLVQYLIGSSASRLVPERNDQVERLYARYAGEMRCICVNHALVDASQGNCQSQSLKSCLTEEEVVLGTILANCTQPRSRQSRAARMKLYAETLVEDIRSHIIVPSRGEGLKPGPGPSQAQAQSLRLRLQDGLRDAWTTWCWAQHHRGEDGKLMYIESFALIALGVILDCLKQLGALPNN
jgi:RNA-dependent RNA polymerase